MKKKMTVTVDGKQYEMEYEFSKSGGRCDVTVKDNELQKYLTDNFTFYITDGEATFLVFNQKIEAIGNQIVTQIRNNEKGTFN